MRVSILLSCMLSVVVCFERTTKEGEIPPPEEQLAQEEIDRKQFAEIDGKLLRPGNSVDQHRKFTFTARASVDRGRNHRLNVLIVEDELRHNERKPDITVVENAGPKVFCNDNCTCDINTPYRTADGSCNNLHKTTWGMASIPMRRFLAPAYDDGISSPRELSSVAGAGNLPSARTVSVKVHTPSTQADQHEEFTHMLMQWGQFLDHDITSTPTQQLTSGPYGTSPVACCPAPGFPFSDSQLAARPECFPIEIKLPDHQFTKNCMNFIRSVQVENAKCTVAPVEQLNQITSYIDASNVYGSSQVEQNDLRTFTMGLLKEGPSVSHSHLPPDASGSSCNSPNAPDYCFKAGDHRVNENPTLQSIHTIFLREHNRIARNLKDINCHWSDEKIFQETRKIVGAIMQEITYNEYLPIVLGPTAMSTYGLSLAFSGYTNNYDKTVDASIVNSFATAAFRMGHSMIRDHLGNKETNYADIPAPADDVLSDVFGLTSHVISDPTRSVGTYSRGLVTDCVQKVDRKMTKHVTDLLFKDTVGNSFDLAALNIQRGRDHGLPAYVKWRKFCDLTVPTSFSDLSPGHSSDAISELDAVYESVNDIDLFPGAMSEEPVPGGLVGPTFACLLAKQFKRLKNGDRFWFEDVTVPFTTDQLAELRKTNLPRILCDNTDTSTIQANAFIKGSPVSCKLMPSIDLTQWKEPLGNSWSGWSKWGGCLSSGIQTRARTCQPCNCGCEGPNRDSRVCPTWTPCTWSKWGLCKNGVQYRYKTCPNCSGSESKPCLIISNDNIDAVRKTVFN